MATPTGSTEPARRLLAGSSELQRRRAARIRLIDFVRYTLPFYRAEPVHELIARHLDAVLDGRLRRLMIFAPPQVGKSQLAAVHLPALWLARRPEDPVILTSYAAALADSKSRQARGLVESSAFARLFPGIGTDRDSRAVDHWQLAGHRGALLAAGVGGPITGHGAQLGIIDDPVENWEQAVSANYRDRVWEWYRTTFRTRIWEGGAIVLIMTRWHADDLAGRLLATDAGAWTVLRLPALGEGRGDPLGRAEGEPLAPGRFSAEALAEIRRDVGPMAWAAEYQGTPRLQEGALLRIERFTYLDGVPEGLRSVRFWDLAASVKTSADYTVGARVGLDAPTRRWVIQDIVRGRWTWPAARRVIIRTALADGPDVVQGIEDVAFQKAAYDDLQQAAELSARSVRSIRPQGDKVNRAGAWAGRLDDGLVVLLRRDWNQAFLEECAGFPVGPHDDQVDAVSGCFQMLGLGLTVRAYGLFIGEVRPRVALFERPHNRIFDQHWRRAGAEE